MVKPFKQRDEFCEDIQTMVDFPISSVYVLLPNASFFPATRVMQNPGYTSIHQIIQGFARLYHEITRQNVDILPTFHMQHLQFIASDRSSRLSFVRSQVATKLLHCHWDR